MRNKIIYEWCIETLDENEDVIDNSFWDELPKEPLEENQQLCLVRNEGNEADGLTDRLWAYVENGKLPEYFTDANGCVVSIKVPQKYSTCK